MQALREELVRLQGEADKHHKINESCSLMKEIRAFHDKINKLKKEAYELDQLMAKVIMPKAFKEANTSSITVDGFRFTMSQTVRASIRKGLKPDAYQWLRENDLGDLITETVNASTLGSAAKHQLEAGMELDEEFFNVAIIDNTSITKS